MTALLLTFCAGLSIGMALSALRRGLRARKRAMALLDDDDVSNDFEARE